MDFQSSLLHVDSFAPARTGPTSYRVLCNSHGPASLRLHRRKRAETTQLLVPIP